MYYTTTEANSATHLLNLSTINHLELSPEDCSLRISFHNEIIRLTYSTPKEAEEVFKEMIKKMNNTLE